MRRLAVTLLLAAPAAAQHLMFWRDGSLTPCATAPVADAAVLVGRLLAGPPPGLATAIPAGTTCVGVSVRPDGVLAVTLDDTLLAARARGRLEDAIQQLTETVLTLRSRPAGVDLLLRGAGGVVRPLRDALGEVERDRAAAPPRLLPASGTGALAGRSIALSPGHGYYWHSTLGWTTQRPLIGGLIEDIHTNEIAMRYLAPYLENLGATVLSCRERGEITRESLGDDDQGAPRYTETGSWFTSGSTGYAGGGYRYAFSSFTESEVATWNVPVAADGSYPVYVFYRDGTNRAVDAAYRIHHSGGTTTVRIDQTRDGLRWRHLGDFWFTAAAGARIELSNHTASLSNRAVIADAVRIGAGLGSVARGAGTSGRPRWQEAARYWAQFAGAPASVWDPIAGGEDNDDDVTTRPRFAEWVGGIDAFFSLHTNAGGGAGTSSYIYSGGATPGSAQLQAAIHDQVIADIRSGYDPGWVDRGKLSANFGEVRLLSTMPGVLLELAFHDTDNSPDHRALHDPDFRDLAARAIARGILRYFAPTAPFPPEPPPAFRVTQDGASGLRLAWDPAPGATAYLVEQSPDGKGFVEVAQTQTTSWSTGVLAIDTALSFRVRACNASGRSMPTDVLCAGTDHTGGAELLLVQGFDRRERTVKAPDNTHDYLRLHGDAIRRGRERSLAFDAATNEAVLLGRVTLAPYRAVDWACGEESTADETFSTAEQALVLAYLQQGGSLLATGAEIGWDLEARGSAADAQFLHQALGVRYVADDANTYGFTTEAGAAFAGLPGGSFDDGSGGTYDVDYADVLAAFDASGRSDLRYATGGIAGVERDTPWGGRTLVIGFPLETVRDPDLRARLMQRALRFLLAPLPLDVPEDLALGAATPLALQVPAAAGAPYLLAAALQAGPPGLPLPGGGLLPLAADGVLQVSLLPNNGVFAGFFGTLDAGGRATAAVVLPPLAALRGLPLFFCGITLRGGAVDLVLPWLRGTVR